MINCVRVLSPRTDDEWHDADVLIAELKEWDVHQSGALGFTRDEVIDVFYPGDVEDVRRQSESPNGCFLLAMDGSQAVGCASFRRLSPDACEVSNVYVRASHRGRRIGSLLLQHLLAGAKAAGYDSARLETAGFMLTAHNLYKSFRFQIREPYRSVPAKFAAVTLWMECKLGG